jgi:hypothetical protein
MRTISIIACTSFLVLWGVYLALKNNRGTPKETTAEVEKQLEQSLTKKGSLLSGKRKNDLDQIGAVINTNTVRLDESTKAEIKLAKKTYEAKQTVKELEAILEDSYLDKNSSLKDLKRLQDKIVEKKNLAKQEALNTEKWDPRFVYYLMMQENYTYAEVNMIKSLTENGLNAEEVEYINELIREPSFMQKISAFKSQGDVSTRTLASFKKNKKKEKDEFTDEFNEGRASAEDKLIEMNYNSDKEEVYGNN